MADNDDLTKPGNKEYLSYYTYQSEWKPTKPIGQVGAAVSSPGPAIVNLPTTIGAGGHDPRKHKAPAYVMGQKDHRPLKTLGPGPAAYDVRKLTNKGYDKCNAPFIGIKLKGYVPYMTPGPAAYDRGASDNAVYHKAPVYSLHDRPKAIVAADYPAPNAYTLPPLMGTDKTPHSVGPSYSMAKKLDCKMKEKSPGPAAYALPSTNINKTRHPAYTMRIRPEVKCSGGYGPGPAGHEMQMVKINKNSAPRFSFGIRHTPYQASPGFAMEK